jgi:hypothetical protein
VFFGDEALYWQDAAGADHLLGQSSAEDAFYLEWSEFDLPPSNGSPSAARV